MYWAFIGTLYLIILTWQDYRHNMLVDDRKNYFMLGASIIMIDLFTHTWYYKLAVFVVVIGLSIVFQKYKLLGEADIKSIAWMFLGFGLVSPHVLMTFAIFFIIMLIIFEVLKRYLMKYRGKLPYYGVLLIIFVTTCLINNLY